jgi:RNA polymerase sigma factor (sigma-70 family)
MMNSDNENDLLKKIREGNSEAFKLLYKKMYPVIANYIRQNGGSETEAKDVFQDAVVVLYRKIQDDTFILSCKIQTFLYSVSRNLWLNEIRSKSILSPEEEIRDRAVEITETDEEDNDIRTRISQLNQSLEKLGEPCAGLLRMFYIDHLSMQDIASRLNYTNSDNAKTQKYKCLMRLKKLFFKNVTNSVNFQN